MKFQLSKIFIIILSLHIFFACDSNNTESTKNEITTIKNKTDKIYKYSKITSPRNQQKYISGDTIQLEISINSKAPKIDSIAIYLDGHNINNIISKPYITKINSTNQKVGTHNLKYNIFYSDKNIEHKSILFIILSDIEPKQYTYKIINTYNHNINAYTQGLTYDGKNLYEGTGQWRESSLRKVKLETGEILNSKLLPDEIFGEGITIYKDEIIQITWQSNKGYVYNKESFALINEFIYPSQGWGITTYNDNLIMSDGTSRLSFIEPETFSEIDFLYVYTNKSEVKNLNELEIINGQLYANVYMSDNIVIIDLSSGKVTGVIDLSGILPKSDYTSRTDVLNGIAFNKESGNLYITGKYWPKLFEIQLVEK